MPETQTTHKADAAAAARIDTFTVEFADNYCRNHTIACLRLRARGAWSITRLHQREGGGRDIGTAMATMPAIPGMYLRVVPKEMKAYLEDPLADQPELLEQINSAAQKARSIWKGVPFKAVPTTELSLTHDLLVTLLLELNRKKEANQLELVKGRLPAIDAIKKLPGRELYDPWSNNSRKPMYVDDVAAWQERLDSAQGM